MLRPISEAGDTPEARTFQALKSQKLREGLLLLIFHKWL